MKISKETHSRVIIWVENDLLERFDKVAEKKHATRSELIRNSMDRTAKKNKISS